MNRAERRLRERLRSALEQERNGRPISGEMRARMTKEKPQDQLWQVMVTERDTKNLIPMGPMMNQDACGLIAEAVNRQIATSGRRDWTKAEPYPMTRISQGVN